MASGYSTKLYTLCKLVAEMDGTERNPWLRIVSINAQHIDPVAVGLGLLREENEVSRTTEFFGECC